MQYRYVQYFDEWNRYLGDFSHKHAALAAGMGTFGWSNLFLTPEFGARVRLILAAIYGNNYIICSTKMDITSVIR